MFEALSLHVCYCLSRGFCLLLCSQLGLRILLLDTELKKKPFLIGEYTYHFLKDIKKRDVEFSSVDHKNKL